MKYLDIIFILFTATLFIACDSSQDGTYCADVDYYNPRTTTQSSYRLTVGVEDNRLVRIDFPSGGYIDESDFNPPLISFNRTSFSTYKNLQYKVKILKKGRDCFDDVNRLVRCKGNTKSGSRCKRMTDNVSGLCFQHE